MDEGSDQLGRGLLQDRQRVRVVLEMPARSIAELLPRRFADLTLDDVRSILAAVGEERESLFFERKAAITNRALAKACAAFANTLGGLLVVGVADENDELLGIDRPAGEVQLWVKDVLRSLVLPLPPFDARFLPLTGDSRRTSQKAIAIRSLRPARMAAGPESAQMASISRRRGVSGS